MPERHRFDLERKRGNPPSEGLAVMLLLALALVYCFLYAWVEGAELDMRPRLWVYTAPAHCAPCRRLDKALACPPMSRFRATRLDPPEGTSFPCIYYRDKAGEWQYFMGWGPGAQAEFLAQWEPDMGRTL